MTAQDRRWNRVSVIRRRRAIERGIPLPPGHPRLALLYPAPYRVGMSSLGFQWVAGLLSGAGFGVERAFADPGTEPILTEESTSPLSDFPLVAVSVAWELELPDLVRALARSGVPPLTRDRTPEHPRVLAGGPLTLVAPGLLAPFADAILVGEADATAVDAVTALLEGGGWRATVERLAGGWVPGRSPPPSAARAAGHLLPARSRLATPETELADMHLVEANRGCTRPCAFCPMRAGDSRRDVEPDRILAAVPHQVSRVGLVGAAVSDHPDLEAVLDALLDRGLGLGISSLRADRVAARPAIAARLRQGGLRTLTVAADATSERLRTAIQKGVREEHLLASAAVAAAEGFQLLKVYAMIGLPGEEDTDVDEFADLLARLAALHPVEVALSPFVPKPGTPLAHAPFAGVARLDARVSRLTDRLRGRVRLRPASSRWAWAEARLAGAGPEGGEAVARAVAEGGSLAALRRALGPDPDHWG
jgi:radical SAM superfamily enzyme YgiQ (UPF0313 family)